ncbi:hypothetical protein B0H14DRAFT_2606303 [Mycena olivaceomarginata]|nr:hypothetical protein B0H14DRAFT_2606303 [Mycena olivaceomarginata]
MSWSGNKFPSSHNQHHPGLASAHSRLPEATSCGSNVHPAVATSAHRLEASPASPASGSAAVRPTTNTTWATEDIVTFLLEVGRWKNDVRKISLKMDKTTAQIQDCYNVLAGSGLNGSLDAQHVQSCSTALRDSYKVTNKNQGKNLEERKIWNWRCTLRRAFFRKLPSNPLKFEPKALYAVRSCQPAVHQELAVAWGGGNSDQLCGRRSKETQSDIGRDYFEPDATSEASDGMQKHYSAKRAISVEISIFVPSCGLAKASHEPVARLSQFGNACKPSKKRAEPAIVKPPQHDSTLWLEFGRYTEPRDLLQSFPPKDPNSDRTIPILDVDQ